MLLNKKQISTLTYKPQNTKILALFHTMQFFFKYNRLKKKPKLVYRMISVSLQNTCLL